MSSGYVAISTHTPLAGSDSDLRRHIMQHIGISTHTPLAGSDRVSMGTRTATSISTHTPLAGSDLQCHFELVC